MPESKESKESKKRKADEAELTDGAGWISDESSFYGDEDQKAQLEALVSSRPLDFDQLAAPRNLNALAYQNILDAQLNPPPKKAKPFNPFEGRTSGRQLHESVQDFVDRLPPRTTLTSTAEDAWIWIANVWSKHRPTDEGRIGTFRERGQQLLDDFTAERAKVEAEVKGRYLTVVNKRLEPKREELREGILQAARETGVVDGKWMMFPPAEDLNWVWETVCEGIVNGELGYAAKVAAKTEQDDDRGNRLICVYTEDFDDRKELRKVVAALKKKGLVQGEKLGFKRPIYYKCDAFTHLDIGSKNKYGLKASMYCSTDFLN